ncbi:acyl-CoA dehydrogenase family protein [Allorhizobium undicola]|uniref:acyl-CoA dehydrogenase family protein n=1 Tax=Allorhizobium undicola TaxID=78527 RepID=UPI0004863F31|nr:acyl-CoA dehydrogenase family protein [Allorhizobium undicola]
MGTITHLHERLRPVPVAIATEEDALRRAYEILPQGASLKRTLRDELAVSGFFGLSIPSDFSGLDVANGILAEVVARLAERAGRAAELLVSHHGALEALRNCGSDEQRRMAFSRVAAGESFHLIDGAGNEGYVLLADAIGYRLTGGEPLASIAPEADWFAVFARNEAGASCLALFSRHDLLALQEDTAVAPPGSGLHISADAVLPCHDNGQCMTLAMGNFLAGALVLGLARAKADVFANIAGTGPMTASRLLLETESVSALLDRCGFAIDAAQVTPTPQTIKAAARAALVVQAAAERLMCLADPQQEDRPALEALSRFLTSE